MKRCLPMFLLSFALAACQRQAPPVAVPGAATAAPPPATSVAAASTSALADVV